MMNIFISYRRADSSAHAGRIYDRLVDAFGRDNVFKDVDDIPLGKDFRGILREAVAKCDVALVIIGPRWVSIQDEDGKRRLDNPGDFVRIEVESALQRDSCLVVPILVDGALMPKADDLPVVLRELAFNNARLVRDDPDFHRDVDKIIRELRKIYPNPTPPPATQPTVETSPSDIYDTIRMYYKARGEQDWERCRKLLAEIRTGGKADTIGFDAAAQEKYIWQEIEDEQAEKRYGIIRLTHEHDPPEQTWRALQAFWLDFPDYDPDQIAEQVRSKAVTTTKQVSADAVQAIIGEPFAWCEVPAGEFLYGRDNRKLSLPTFAMAKYPITYSQYQVFVDANDGFRDERWRQGLAQRAETPGEQEWEIQDHPRENVSWYDAMAFCRWLSWKLGGAYKADQLTKWLVRLPTEFEWEKAARGTEGLLYPYGNKFNARKSNTLESGIGKTTPVIQYKQGASPYGVLDMSGNVRNWCLTDYDDPQMNVDQEDVNLDSRRVVRGGSWHYNLDYSRAVFRTYLRPTFRNSHVGFRLVRPPS